MNATGLAPMDLGDVVSSGWMLCLRNWPRVASMATITWLGMLFFDVGLLALLERLPSVFALRGPVPAVPGRLALLLAPGVLLVFCNQLALVRFCLEAAAGDGAAVGRSYLAAMRSLLPALAAMLITWVVVTAAMLTWLGIPIGVFFFVSWFFVIQICLAEGERNPFAALYRSRTLVRGSWWHTAGVLAGVLLLGLLPSLAAGAVRPAAAGPSLAISALASAIAAPFLAAAQTMLYLDLRVRKHESIALTPS